MRRYSAVMSMISGGICNSRKNSGRHARDNASMATVITAMKPNEMAKLCFIRSVSPAPQSMENKTPLPMHRPSSTDVRNTIAEYDAPTAASASAPMQRPTMKVSATLYSC